MMKKRCLMFLIILIGILITNLLPVSAGPRLDNSIGLHAFDFSKEGEYFCSNGYITIVNSGINESAEYILTISNELNEVDYDEDGNPREHYVTENVTFDALSNTNWITFEDNKIIIPPEGTYVFKYTIRMSKEEAYKSINKDTSNGFLAYINVKGKTGNVLGINYNYKMFIVFTGVYNPTPGISIPPHLIIVYIIIGIAILTLIVVTYKQKKLAKDSKGKEINEV